MKFQSLLLGLLLTFSFTSITQAQSVDKKWALSLEVGSGNIAGLNFARSLTKAFDLGLGAIHLLPIIAIMDMITEMGLKMVMRTLLL